MDPETHQWLRWALGQGITVGLAVTGAYLLPKHFAHRKLRAEAIGRLLATRSKLLHDIGVAYTWLAAMEQLALEGIDRAHTEPQLAKALTDAEESVRLMRQQLLADRVVLGKSLHDWFKAHHAAAATVVGEIRKRPAPVPPVADLMYGFQLSGSLLDHFLSPYVGETELDRLADWVSKTRAKLVFDDFDRPAREAEGRE